MSLCACLITRNEEKKIERLLRSITGVVDEVVVADTGSTDQTLRIAAGFGARISIFEWQDDFSAACNFALSQARTDWILWINPDEELTADSRNRLRPYLSTGNVLGYVVRVQDLGDAANLNSFTETLQARLFRRHPDIRYIGRLHPRFAVPLPEIAQREGKQILGADVILRRHAYLSILTEAKLRWAVRLLELELQDRPNDLHYMIEYGRSLLQLNDPRGHAVLAEAAAMLLPVLDAPAAPSPTVRLLLEYLLTVSAEQSQSRLSREKAVELAIQWFPQSPPILWRLAELLFNKGAYRPAAELLARLVRCGQTGAYDRSAAFKPEIIGASAMFNLAVCHARLGEVEKAKVLLNRVLDSKLHGEQARRCLADLQSAQT